MSDARARHGGPPRGARRRARRPRRRSARPTSPRDFQDLITRYAWGEIWTRPGLDRRTRSAITLTALIALRARRTSSRMHVRAALRNGLTPDEIKEVLLQTRDLLRRAGGELGVRDRAAGARGGVGLDRVVARARLDRDPAQLGELLQRGPAAEAAEAARLHAAERHLRLVVHGRAVHVADAALDAARQVESRFCRRSARLPILVAVVPPGRSRGCDGFVIGARLQARGRCPRRRRPALRPESPCRGRKGGSADASSHLSL